MFFALSKLLNFLVFPLSLGLLFLLASALLRRRSRAAWAVFWIGFAALYLCSLKPVADALLAPLEGPFRGQPAPAKAGAIVVLGGMSELGSEADGFLDFNENADRFIAALALARSIPDSVLVFSGGSGALFDQANSEAPALARVAEGLGFPAQRILTEPDSRNTHENAVFTRRLLEGRHMEPIILVTSAFHMPRSLGCFRAAGVPVTPYAVDFRGQEGLGGPLFFVPDVAHLANSTMAIKEYVGLTIYRLRGYVR
jgi:uncharacterized SAM-binding protein YcdF (DUF218 family)